MAVPNSSAALPSTGPGTATISLAQQGPAGKSHGRRQTMLIDERYQQMKPGMVAHAG